MSALPSPRVIPASARITSFSLLLLLGILAVQANAAALGTWDEISVGKPAKTDITGVAFGNNTWVIVGKKGYIATSTNGTKWSRRSAGITRDFNGVRPPHTPSPHQVQAQLDPTPAKAIS